MARYKYIRPYKPKLVVVKTNEKQAKLIKDYIVEEKTTAYKVRIASDTWWSNLKRHEKLVYIMNKYNDIDKAARVLGCNKDQATRRWLEHLNPPF